MRLKFKKTKLKFQGLVSIQLNTVQPLPNFFTQRILYSQFSAMGSMDYLPETLKKVMKATWDCDSVTTGFHTTLGKKIKSRSESKRIKSTEVSLTTPVIKFYITYVGYQGFSENPIKTILKLSTLTCILFIFGFERWAALTCWLQLSHLTSNPWWVTEETRHTARLVLMDDSELRISNHWRDKRKKQNLERSHISRHIWTQNSTLPMPSKVVVGKYSGLRRKHGTMGCHTVVLSYQ